MGRERGRRGGGGVKRGKGRQMSNVNKIIGTTCTALSTDILTISSSALSATSLGFTILRETFAYGTIFQSNHRDSHIPSSWMARAGCVSVACIHPFGT